HHIYLAVGRDYLDVAPIRGVREKGGTENMMSVVQVLAC
ncbi:transglutaminase family protein, partial [Acinetobacter baumannii]